MFANWPLLYEQSVPASVSGPFLLFPTVTSFGIITMFGKMPVDVVILEHGDNLLAPQTLCLRSYTCDRILVKMQHSESLYTCISGGYTKESVKDAT